MDVPLPLRLQAAEEEKLTLGDFVHEMNTVDPGLGTDLSLTCFFWYPYVPYPIDEVNDGE